MSADSQYIREVVHPAMNVNAPGVKEYLTRLDLIADNYDVMVVAIKHEIELNLLQAEAGTEQWRVFKSIANRLTNVLESIKP